MSRGRREAASGRPSGGDGGGGAALALTARPLEIMRFTALPPPPPQPTTLMRASPVGREGWHGVGCCSTPRPSLCSPPGPPLLTSLGTIAAKATGGRGGCDRQALLLLGPPGGDAAAALHQGPGSDVRRSSQAVVGAGDRGEAARGLELALHGLKLLHRWVGCGGLRRGCRRQQTKARGVQQQLRLEQEG